MVDVHLANVQQGLAEGVLSYKMTHKMYTPIALKPECHVAHVHEWIYKNMLNIIDDAAEKYPNCHQRQLMYALETSFKAGMQSGANYMQLKNEFNRNKDYGKSVQEQIALTKADFHVPETQAPRQDIDEVFEFDDYLLLDDNTNQ